MPHCARVSRPRTPCFKTASKEIMGEIRHVTPVCAILAVVSRYEAALEWARAKTSQSLGVIALISDAFDFTETDYYTPAMGPGLKKQFLAFERPIDPGELAAIKRQTNDWEAEYAALRKHAESRPLNLDPGYITPAKLVLASTKDHAHRIYLGNGIYAEVTLSFRGGCWRPLEWTYPDYRREDFQRFFTQCRRLLVDASTK
jgi:Domain of unknown function (DUF4416)